MTAKDLKAAIGPLKARSESDKKPRERGRTVQPFVSRALASFALRERVEAHLQTYLDALVDAIRELNLRRHFYEGAWVIGVSADLPEGKRYGRPYFAFTRIEFAITVDPETEAVELTCRSTVRNRDYETTHLSVPADADHRDQLEGYIETSCLRFAQRFFEVEPVDESVN